MIEGAKSRVPDADHWKKIYGPAEQSQPLLILELASEIRKHIASLREFNSTAGGAAILENWARHDEWSRLFPRDSSELFGMVVWTTLFDDTAIWRSTFEDVGGRRVRVYRRV
jgi:hypothetical protein